ncbi:hypothetical protein SMACR_03251 [Sordaria macrospora]|uniref:WGS project CABT00000000 data, contig 2.10 n=2 Tax=Sordaria macrospora TaxID=5147 RepID=F7VWC3_SORMK|nr:uncharacterized protein SMAC_03251 [Sordaria macrospora k-hell]KAA8635687.1 hypothetical protein SMACR_03251 [Sordaria macrospora]KAH7630113.1 hypothetical protein B0T09DRAFT_383675 [Sordaria sp. MPI-SDFR-AT-0083]WPJ66792.1 hypothetical protein SMAC4_03251 [Sordaria macrospora]CCC09691.1 unnamed protein product [Sordaria macrospora k-hell]
MTAKSESSRTWCPQVREKTLLEALKRAQAALEKSRVTLEEARIACDKDRVAVEEALDTLKKACSSKTSVQTGKANKIPNENEKQEDVRKQRASKTEIPMRKTVKKEIAKKGVPTRAISKKVNRGEEGRQEARRRLSLPG